MASIEEIARDLATACLNQEHFASGLAGAEKEAKSKGTKIGEFYQGTYKAVEKAIMGEE